MNMIGRLIAWGIFGLCSIVSTEVTSQEELIVRQVGQSLEFEFRLDDPSSFQLFYSINEGNTWSLINQDCLGPLKKLPNGRASVVWNVLECEESFVQEDVIFKLTAGSCSPVEFDGYTYDVVQIGEQCWFAENLRSTHYANGDVIPGDLTDSEWWSLKSGAQAGYLNNKANLNKYGRLYNKFAVLDARGLCPSGWHVPTDDEFMTLEMELGMSESEANSDGGRGTDQGAQMKATASDSPSWNGTNSSGFSALPGGYRRHDGYFDDVGYYAYFWSASPGRRMGWNRVLYYGNDRVSRDYNVRQDGFSVRCVRDE